MLRSNPVFFRHSPPLNATPRRATPTSITLVAERCKSMDQLKQIHAQMITTARIHDDFAASRLINFSALSNSGDLSYALKLFHNIPEPNPFMWNTLIRAQARSSNPVDGLLFYAEMRRRAVAPRIHTFPFVLKSCWSPKLVKFTEHIHAELLKFGFDCDMHAANGLIKAYSVWGRISDARKVFDEMSERDSTVWTTVICGFAQNESAEEAIVLFEKMISEGIEPSEVVLSSVLSACAQSPCLALGEQIHAYIEEKGIELNVILGTALVNMYAKNGALNKAKQCFDGLRVRNVATWNAMIHGLAVHGRADEALRFFETMERERVKPNAVTLTGVLSACCHAGMLEFGREVFHSMKRVYGVEPNLKHYGCMVDLLGRGGSILEAEAMIRGMVWKANVVIWVALLSACKNWGNIEVAERVVEEIHKLDPKNHGVHVVLSNMYAEAGRWEEVMRWRKVIRKQRLKKTAGSSMVVSADYM